MSTGITPHTTRPATPAMRDDDMVAFGQYQLFPELRLLMRDGTRLELGERAADILILLVGSAGEVISKDTLLSTIWPDDVVEENNLQAQISALRKILGNDRGLIATEFGRGYRFTGQVRQHRAVTAAVTTLQVPRGLPRPRSPLIGRIDELLEIKRILATRSICTLSGPAGIGKTRLAIEAASASAAYFPDGIYFADLSQLGSATAVWPTISSSLSALYGPDTQAVHHPHKALLVVDNCEHLAQASATTLAQLLNADPQLCVLLTSQTPLALDDEQVYRLGPLDLPANTVTLANARNYSAIELFVRRIQSADYHFQLTEDNVADVTNLCRSLDGIPLALEIAAARVPSLGIKAVADDLAHPVRLLDTSKKLAEHRHRTLGDALQWSYQLLSPDEQRVFQILAIFPGDFDIRAAEHLLSAESIPPARAIDLICSLVDKSLISSQAGTQPLRYRYLSILRTFALARLGQRIDQVAHQHARFTARMVEHAKQDWISLSTTQWKRQYTHHIDNIRAALDWSLEDNHDRALGLGILAHASPFWIQLSLHDECRWRITSALSDIQALPVAPYQEMMIQAALGTSLTWAQGPIEANGQAWMNAGRLAAQLGDKELQLQSEYGLWIYTLRHGLYAQSLQHGQRMGELASAYQDQAALLTARRLMGTSHHFLGNQHQALAAIESMLDSYPRDDRYGSHFRFGLDQRVAGWAFLARTFWLTGNTSKALRAANIAVDEAVELDHACSLCCAIIEGSCTVAAFEGDFDEVRRLAQQVEQIAGEHGLEFWRLYATTFSFWATALDKPDHVSVQDIESVVATLQNNGFDLAYTLFLSGFAEVLLQKGYPQKAYDLVTHQLASISPDMRLWSAPELMRLACVIATDNAVHPSNTSFTLQSARALAKVQGAIAWENRIGQ